MAYRYRSLSGGARSVSYVILIGSLSDPYSSTRDVFGDPKVYPALWIHPLLAKMLQTGGHL